MTNGLYAAVVDLPLKEMDGTLLSVTIREEAGRLGMDVPKVAEAIALAAYLHRNQVRKIRGRFPVTPYIEHPLRGALRYLRYGGTDQNVLIAIILHDTVEDCLKDLVALSGYAEDDTVLGLREKAFTHLENVFNSRVSDLVAAVTNPVGEDGRSKEQKRLDYALHVAKVIEDPDVAVVKFVDFIDNAAGLHHQTQYDNLEAVLHLSKKYEPLVDIFLVRLAWNDIYVRVSKDGFRRMTEQLLDAGRRLSRMANS